MIRTPKVYKFVVSNTQIYQGRGGYHFIDNISCYFGMNSNGILRFSYEFASVVVVEKSHAMIFVNKTLSCCCLSAEI